MENMLMKAHNATQLLSSALSPRDGAGASGGTPGPFYGLYRYVCMCICAAPKGMIFSRFGHK